MKSIYLTPSSKRTESRSPQTSRLVAVLFVSIAGLAPGLAALHAAAAPDPITPVLESLVDRQIVPGAVALVANREKVLALKTAGCTSLARKTPMRADAVFWIASMSKSLTGTALMMLVDEGKIRLADPVEKFLPEFKGQQVRAADGTLHPPKPVPTHADVSFGPHPHQLIDIYLPKTGKGSFPAVLWFGGIWKAAKHPANLGFFNPKGIAVIAVQVRTMEDAVAVKEKVPISYVQTDAIRAVQFVRHHAAKWNLDPQRLAVGGGSQGAQPALFVGCTRDQANAMSGDPVERESSLVTCVAAFRCQPTLDPVRMQEWVPGVKWGAPALGVSFEESLKRHDELLPIIRKWSPDHLLHKNAAPMFFENEWSLSRPDDVTQVNYDVHSPAWALGFQKSAVAAGAKCHVKFPGHPADHPAKDIWDFVFVELKRPIRSKL